MGHLMCAACFTHLLADGRYEIKNWRKLNTLKNYLEWFDQTLWTISVNESSWLLTISFSLFPFFPLAVCSLRDQIATCPNCRVEISKSTASRNLAVEKAASELPSECQVSGEVKAPWPLRETHSHVCHIICSFATRSFPTNRWSVMNNTSARNDQQSANIIALAASGVDPIMTVSKGERLLWKHLNLLSISSISISSALYLYLLVSCSQRTRAQLSAPSEIWLRGNGRLGGTWCEDQRGKENV